ncbi:MAG TPA: cytochrome P450 [Jiangellaceae bacterium]
MTSRRVAVLDSTASLLATGFSWLPSRWRRSGQSAVRARLLGKPAIALRGPDAIPYFYDEQRVRRSGAVPKAVQKTLFGEGAVQTLDGDEHRVRKAMFLGILTDPNRVDALVRRTAEAWDDAAQRWISEPSVVLFDEAAQVHPRRLRVGGRPARRQGRTAVGEAVRRNSRRLRHPVPAAHAGQARPEATRKLAHEAHRGDAQRCGREPLRHHRNRVGRRTRGSPPRRRRRVAQASHRGRGAAQHSQADRRRVVFVTFAAHAMHRWPEQRQRVQEGDADYLEAFAQEVRRFYPFAPFVGGRATMAQIWREQQIPAGGMVLLDLYGQNHDAALWPEPYTFSPDRFLHRQLDSNELVPQGGGDPAAGHRCPGEQITVELIKVLAAKLAAMQYDVPDQDLRISLTRIPTRPRSGFVMTNVRPPDR